MADTLKFGPEWLRQLSSGGNMTSPPPSPSFGGKYKLAENRYGREEMLALFTPNPKAPDDLRQFTSILVERCQDPMAMIAPTEDEQHLLASSVNSTVALRQVMGRGGSSERGPPGMRGASRGGMSGRGRGRGRGEPTSFYQRGVFDEPLPGRGDSSRGRGGREGGATKVIERDSSGFLSARSFDESTDRRSKDPYSRSTPASGDRWSELRSNRAEPGGRPTGVPPEPQPDDSSQSPAVVEERDDDWRRAGKDRQPRGNWRDAKPSFDDDTSPRYPRGGVGGFNRQMSYERSRSRHQEDEIPEWATDDMGAGDEGGTFDSSGAFLSLKEADDDKPSQNGEFSKRDRKQEIDKAKKGLPPLKMPQRSLSTTHESPSVTESTPHSSTQPPSTTAEGSDIAESKPSTTNIPSNQSTPRKEDLSSQSQGKQTPQAGSTEVDQRSQEPEADFGHLTEAAEQMMATWAAEDDDPLPDTVVGPQAPPPQSSPMAPTDPATINTISHPHDWFYKDPQGIVQGPFKGQEMAEWYGAGYFTMTLLVKKGSDREFQPLGEILKRGNAQPFVQAADATVHAAAPDNRIQQQQMFLLQQQQLLLQQQQQIALLRQQQQLQHIVQTISTREEYSNLNQQQLQQMALAMYLKEEHKQQELLLQQTHTSHNKLPGLQQTSPPQQTGNGTAPGTPLASADDDMLWGAATRSWSQQMRERQAVDEIAQKEASRQQEQRLEAERQMEQQRLERQQEQQRLERQQEQQRLERQEQQRLEIERQMLEARKQADEQRRIQEEKVKAEIRLQREQMEKQQRELEEKKRQEIERQELEKKRMKEKQLEFERQREIERQQLAEKERQQEIERKIEQETRRKAELKRKKEEEERAHKEAMEAESARRQDQQRQEQQRQEKELARLAVEKERERQAERERLEALQLPSTAQWASSPNSSAAFDRQQSLQEIQQKEKEQAAKDRAAKAAAEKQRQLEQQELNSQQTQLKWAASKPQSPVNVGRSLRQIQEEEALRLEKERNEQQKAAPVVASGPSASWGSGKAVPVTGWASEGAWGNAVRKNSKGGSWEQPASRPVKASNSEVFPSLAVSASKPQQSASNAQTKRKPTNTAQNSKKHAQNDKVKKIFQSTTASHEDKFTEWCTKSLQGLNSSIDVPTFIAFLRDVDNPYEVQDYVNNYLGENAKSAQFARDFVERRSLANKQKLAEQRMDDEESLWGPAPAVNPSAQRSAETSAVAMDKKKKAVKKTKGQKTDASALLGFTVGASSHRLNIGEIEKAE